MAAVEMTRLGTLLAVLGLLAQPAVAENWRRSVQNEIAAVARAVDRFRDIRNAQAEGWRRTTGHVPLMGEHWAQRDGVDYVIGDALDLSKPSNLIYADIGGRKELVAVAYVIRIGPNDPLPGRFSGPADVWHVQIGRAHV